MQVYAAGYGLRFLLSLSARSKSGVVDTAGSRPERLFDRQTYRAREG